MLLGPRELSSVLECIFCKPNPARARRKSGPVRRTEESRRRNGKSDDREKTKVKCVITASDDFSSTDLALAWIVDR
ncbi:hypothetical protein TNIN_215731 [Trichonephila inaurata madagascariensis]|uniref:Uncharacterized protein n=1 Tax=Trichonephila inaurata madagascariensis TaxID=2747483 RepID=A0A8X6KM05_9ARAC|nr:hypothetical protein TNIN_215731 [Trichonephila inaurata madagascariensis]